MLLLLAASLDPQNCFLRESEAVSKRPDLSKSIGISNLACGGPPLRPESRRTLTLCKVGCAGSLETISPKESYSAQQESFAGSLRREMAAILRASAIVGYTCRSSIKSLILAWKRRPIAAS